MVGLQELMRKDKKLVIGLMSGTSLDGIDAALVELQGSGTGTKAQLLHFINKPYTPRMRSRILTHCDGGGTTASLCQMNFLLGHQFAQAALELCQAAGLPASAVDLVGSHGQTVYHLPDPVEDEGFTLRSTLQIGEPAVIAAKTGAVTVGNFRVADMAWGGNGAPLVPYTEYLLYSDPQRHLALQNIGGIGNITLLPRGCRPEEILAFDTGPGNMVIDGVVAQLTGGQQHYDQGGRMGLAGKPCQPLLNQLLADPYFARPAPKTTGREYFGRNYTQRLLEQAAAYGLGAEDTVATATVLTAYSIAQAVDRHIPPHLRPQRLIVGGGGSYNLCLLRYLCQALPDVEVLTNEDMGQNSDAKEAVAFAVLANETVHGQCGNLPSATGASRPAVLGCIYQ